MPVKCTKCIDLLRERKRKLELIHDLRPKSESIHHTYLKAEVCNLLRKIFKEKLMGFPTSIDTEVSVEGIGRVDVVGQIGEGTIAVECGNTDLKKILALEERFDVVLHIPFCHTWNLVNINIDEIVHQLFVSIVGKELERRGVRGMEKNKIICLEEDECSLPSGRDGYPEEALQRVGLSINSVKKRLKNI